MSGDDPDDPPVERTELFTGVNPWKRVKVTSSEIGRRRWEKEMADHGVAVTCIRCGKVWTVHPYNAQRALYCGQSCRAKAHYYRKKNGEPSPAHTPEWQPWKYRRNA